MSLPGQGEWNDAFGLRLTLSNHPPCTPKSRKPLSHAGISGEGVLLMGKSEFSVGSFEKWRERELGSVQDPKS